MGYTTNAHTECRLVEQVPIRFAKGLTPLRSCTSVHLTNLSSEQRLYTSTDDSHIQVCSAVASASIEDRRTSSDSCRLYTNSDYVDACPLDLLCCRRTGGGTITQQTRSKTPRLGQDVLDNRIARCTKFTRRHMVSGERQRKDEPIRSNSYLLLALITPPIIYNWVDRVPNVSLFAGYSLRASVSACRI